MSLWLALCRAAGLDVGWERLLGLLMTGSDSRAAAAGGYVLHLTIAVLLAAVDTWLLARVERRERLWLAAALGLGQALALGALVGALMDGPGVFLAATRERAAAAAFTLGVVLLTVTAAALGQGTARMQVLRLRLAWRRVGTRPRAAPRLSALRRGPVRTVRRQPRTVPPVWAVPRHT